MIPVPIPALASLSRRRPKLSPTSNMTSVSHPRQLDVKRRRTTQACDYCHQRSIRCRSSENGPTCQNCEAFAQQCTYNRKPRKRGIKPRHSNPHTDERLPRQDDPQPRMNQTGLMHENENRGSDLVHRGVGRALSRVIDPWKAPTIASHSRSAPLPCGRLTG